MLSNDYRTSSNKTRWYYYFTQPSNAGFIENTTFLLQKIITIAGIPQGKGLLEEIRYLNKQNFPERL